MREDTKRQQWRNSEHPPMKLSIPERAAAYLERLPPAVAGSGGHAATFNAAAALVRGFAMNEADALPILTAWNQTHCLPLWSLPELRHKLKDASTSSRPLGYLLNDDAPSRGSTAPDFENDAEKKARQRKAWPEFKTLKPAGIKAIATLRHMLPDAVDLAHQHGLLKGAEIDGHKCFIIHEGTFAQARRLDGLPLTMQDGTESKPKTLLGSQGAFIGQRLLGNTSHVLLVEGVIGLMEALAAFLLVDVKKNWSVIAAVSAYSRFRRDPALLSRLAGRHVRIVPDNDEKGTGLDAAASWLADMENAGAFVNAIKLPPECKDLGPVVSDPLRYQPFLNALFK
jgi:hypothetical protein